MDDLEFLEEPNSPGSLSSSRASSNLADIGDLGDSRIANQLFVRYRENNHYVPAGKVLIALPLPRSEFTHAHDLDSVKKLSEMKSSEVDYHLYTLVKESWDACVRKRISQTIIFGGIRSSGKRENAQRAVEYLASMNASSGQEVPKNGSMPLCCRIVRVYEILEAFSTSDPNSLRMGSLIDIRFDKSRGFCGAHVFVSLIEQSGILDNNEEVFSVFYLLVHGTGQSMRERCNILSAEQYFVLNEGSRKSQVTSSSFAQDCRDKFDSLVRSLNVVGVSESEMEEIWTILSVILRIGNICGDQNYLKRIEDLAVVARLLHAPENQLKENFRLYGVPYLHSLSQRLYYRVFYGILSTMNNGFDTCTHVDAYQSVYVVVLPDFESSGKYTLVVDSLDTFCVNYVNEKVNSYVMDQIFNVEQRLYAAEGIGWEFSNFGVELEGKALQRIENPLSGIINALESGDFRDSSISIDHFTGRVEYDTRDWVAKNSNISNQFNQFEKAKCILDDTLLTLIKSLNDSSLCNDCALHWRSQPKTARCREDTFSLLDKMKGTNLRFVVSISVPDVTSHPQHSAEFESQFLNLVSHQVKSFHIPSIVKFFRTGYPYHFNFDEFLTHFACLAPPTSIDVAKTAAERCVSILSYPRVSHTLHIDRREKNNSIGMEMWKVGKGKVFLRSTAFALLSRMRSETEFARRSTIAIPTASDRGIVSEESKQKPSSQYSALDRRMTISASQIQRRTPDVDIGNVTLLSRSPDSAVYCGVFKRNPAVFKYKVRRSDQYGNVDSLNGLHQEFRILNEIDSPHVVKALDIVRDNTNAQIVLIEEYAGNALATFDFSSPNRFELFLLVATQLAQGLCDIHSADIMHRDITPKNIVFDDLQECCRFVDFDSASQLPMTSQSSRTIDYMSPEQSGRINRHTDYRTDFYSLGVTLFEILTGFNPFRSDDDYITVWKHLSVTPQRVDEICEHVPRSVGRVISKLIAKSPESRYQSASGLLHDFNEITANLHSSKFHDSFEPGRRDSPERFMVSLNYYGREEEQKGLIEAIERVAKGARFEPIFIAGISGAGKTFFVEKVAEEGMKRKWLFMSGTHEQSNVDYGAMMEALKSVANILQSKTGTNTLALKTKIVNSLGDDTYLLCNFVPELRSFLFEGKNPIILPSEALHKEQHFPFNDIGSKESRQRLKIVFKRFLQCLGEPWCPLVLVLDDLQWIDSCSASLLSYLLCDGEIELRNFMFIGCYRDDDKEEYHEFRNLMSVVRSRQANHRVLKLKPLSQNAVANIVADSVHSDVETVEELSSSIYGKSLGNPFIVKSLLNELHNQSLIFREDNRWNWDISRIRAVAIDDDSIVGAYLQFISTLDSTSDSILQIIASCATTPDFCTRNLIGYVLRSLNRENASNMESALQRSLSVLVRAYLIFAKANEVFVCAHDQIQESVLKSIDPVASSNIRFRIAKYLRRFSKQERNRIAAMEHYFLCVGSIPSSSPELFRIAELALSTACETQQISAFVSARKYLRTGILALKSWSNSANLCTTSPDLYFSLHIELATVELSLFHHDEAEKIAREILENVSADYERAKILVLLVDLKNGTGQYTEAVEFGMECLGHLGIDLPTPALLEAHILKEGDLCVEVLSHCNHDALVQSAKEKVSNQKRFKWQFDKEEREKELISLMITTLTCLGTSLYLLGDRRCVLVNIRAVSLSLEYGVHVRSALAFLSFANTIVASSRNYQIAVKIGKLGIRIAEEFGVKNILSRALAEYGSFLSHWTDRLDVACTTCRKAIKCGMDAGAPQSSGFGMVVLLIYQLRLGVFVPSLMKSNDAMLQLCVDSRHELSLDILNGINIILHTLFSHYSGGNITFSSTKLDEKTYLDSIGTRLSSAFFVCNKSIVLYICGDHVNSVRAMEVAIEQYRPYRLLGGSFLFSDSTYFHALGLLAILPSMKDESEIEDSLKIIRESISLLGVWAENCPANYEHRLCLARAELAIYNDDQLTAIGLYDKSLQGARDSGHVLDEAIVANRIADFWLSTGRNSFAKDYLISAYNLFSGMQARLKMGQMECKYDFSLSTTQAPDPNGSASASASPVGVATTMFLTSRRSSPLDIQAPRRASQVSFASSSDTSRRYSDLFQSTPTPSFSSNVDDDGNDNEDHQYDFETVKRAVQTFSNSADPKGLLESAMGLILKFALAEYGVLFLTDDDEQLVVQAVCQDDQTTRTLQSIPLEEASSMCCINVVNESVCRNAKILLEDAMSHHWYCSDEYCIEKQCRSILCVPFFNQSLLLGVLYLENNEMTGVFSHSVLDLLTLISSQVGVSLKMAFRYQKLQEVNEKLQSSELQFRTLAESAPLGIVLLDRNLDLVYMNEMFSKVFGDCETYRDLFDLGQSDSSQKLWKEYSRSFKPFTDEIQFVFPSGMTKWCLTSLKPIYNSAPSESVISGHILTINDISEQKLLNNAIPKMVVERLLQQPHALTTNNYIQLSTNATIMFADIVGFTRSSEKMLPIDLIRQLNSIYTAFDEAIARQGLTRLKIIGDCYMVIGGVLDVVRSVDPDGTRYLVAMLKLAFEMREIAYRKSLAGEPVRLRIGIHCGPVASGIIGTRNLAFDVWGRTVNAAKRLQESVDVGGIMLTSDTVTDRLSHFDVILGPEASYYIPDLPNISTRVVLTEGNVLRKIFWRLSMEIEDKKQVPDDDSNGGGGGRRKSLGKNVSSLLKNSIESIDISSSNIDQKLEGGLTILFLALLLNCEDVVRWCMYLLVDIEQTYEGLSPLVQAIRHCCDLPIITLLLQKCAEVSNAMFFACVYGRLDVVHTLLLQKNRAIETDILSFLITAADYGHELIVRKLLEHTEIFSISTESEPAKGLIEESLRYKNTFSPVLPPCPKLGERDAELLSWLLNRQFKDISCVVPDPFLDSNRSVPFSVTVDQLDENCLPIIYLSLRDGSHKLMIDCNLDAFTTARQLKIGVSSFDFCVTNYVGSHVKGLEPFSFDHIFGTDRVDHHHYLFINRRHIAPLWNGSLSGGLCTFEGMIPTLETFVAVNPLNDFDCFLWHGIRIWFIRNDNDSKYCSVLFVCDGEKTIINMDPNEILEAYYPRADVIYGKGYNESMFCKPRIVNRLANEITLKDVRPRPMKSLLFVGASTAFSDNNTNAILEVNDHRLLIDCGGTYFAAARRMGLDPLDVEAVYISHLHLDHVGGLCDLLLEWKKRNRNLEIKEQNSKKLKLFVSVELLYGKVTKRLWENCLESAMEDHMFLEDYVDVCSVISNGSFDWFGVNCALVRTQHVMDCDRVVPTFGLMIGVSNSVLSDSKRQILFTSDTKSVVSVEDYIETADLVFHDCSFVSNPVHAGINELLLLPEEIRRKTWLMHCNIDEIPKVDDLVAQFAGVVHWGQIFDLENDYD